MSAGRVLRTGGLWFDGINDYVAVPHNDALNRGLGEEVTLCFWMNIPTFLSGYRCILTKGRTLIAASANYAVRYYFYYGPYLEFLYHNPSQNWNVWRTVATQMVAGKPYHIAVTFRFGTKESIRFYINSTLISGSWIQGSGSDPPYISTQPLWIGRSYPGEYYNGYIDEVRIYNRALSIDEIKAIYERDEFIKDGLVLCLDFSEYEGNIAYDKSGYGNHGTIYGGAMWVVKKALRVLPKAG